MATEQSIKSLYDPSLLPLILSEAAAVTRALSFAGGHLIIVGGLVPSLLVPVPEAGIDPHVGTLDLDVCLSIALQNGEVGLYDQLQKGLEVQGFAMVREDSGPASWRWKKAHPFKITLEFLCAPPSDGSKQPGQLYRPGGPIAGKLSALVFEAGRLVNDDVWPVQREVELPGKKGRQRFEFHVAGPMSWLVSKIHALLRREKAKDAYDIVWLIESWPGGQAELATVLKKASIFDSPTTRAAMEQLAREFESGDRIGPAQYANFMEDDGDAREGNLLRAQAAVHQLIRLLSP